MMENPGLFSLLPVMGYVLSSIVDAQHCRKCAKQKNSAVGSRG